MDRIISGNVDISMSMIISLSDYCRVPISYFFDFDDLQETHSATISIVAAKDETIAALRESNQLLREKVAMLEERGAKQSFASSLTDLQQLKNQ